MWKGWCNIDNVACMLLSHWIHGTVCGDFLLDHVLEMMSVSSMCYKILLWECCWMFYGYAPKIRFLPDQERRLRACFFLAADDWWYNLRQGQVIGLKFKDLLFNKLLAKLNVVQYEESKPTHKTSVAFFNKEFSSSVAQSKQSECDSS